MQSTRRLFHVAQKPGREEVMLSIKISLVGVGIIGVIGFIIRVLFWLIGLYQLPGAQATPTVHP